MSATTHLTHLDRLRDARQRVLSEENVARIVEPTDTYPTHLVTSPYFFVGPKRPQPLDVIRLVCEREDRRPVRGEVMELAGTATRIVGVVLDPPFAYGRQLSVTFTCHGTDDVVRSCGRVRDRGVS